MKPDYSFQDRDVKKIWKALHTSRSVLYVLPTGGGKTNVAVQVLLRWVKRYGAVVAIAHRRDLIHQMYERLLSAGIPESELGVIMAGDPRQNPDALIQVASIDTLKNRDLPPATLVLVDEAHRSVSAKWLAVLDAYADARILGLTATPFRFDGLGLGRVFETFVQGPTMAHLFDAGVLNKPEMYTHDANEIRARLRGAKKSGNDYSRRDLELRVNAPILVGSIVKHYEKHGRNRPAIVFAVSLEHAKAIRKQFKRRGYAVEHIDASTPKEERDALKERVRSGQTQIVTNVEVFTEGWDCPEIRVCIMARPTMSVTLFLQMCGRGLRAFGDGFALILDHAGNIARHKEPWFLREWDLENGDRGGMTGQAPMKCCGNEMCGAWISAGFGECPECGFAFEETRRVEEEAGELQRWGEELRGRLEALAKTRGFPKSWSASAIQELGLA